MTDLQHHPWHKKGKVTSDPEVWQLIPGQVVASHTSGDTDDGNEDNEVAEILIKSLGQSFLPCGYLLDERG
jgi:hypothetical protein